MNTTPEEAELAKLFCNIYRYINFAIPNYFMYLAEEFNVEPFRLLDAMNTGYPRNAGLKKPGFAAGTCLRKDFGMINEHFPQTDLLLQAYKINEYLQFGITFFQC
jgi:UDP-N-acetyl-D-mannosaminuronic acid dehydrogenase